MYCFTMLSGAPPTEPAKYEPDQALRPPVVAGEAGGLLAQPSGGDSLEAVDQLGYGDLRGEVRE
jgi:hypothetical protein